MLETNVRSKVQAIPQNSMYQQYGALLHTTGAVHSLLDEMFPNSGTGTYCPRGRPGILPKLAPLHVSLNGTWETSGVLYFCA